MDLNGLMAALAATGDKLNAAEMANAQLRARIAELEAALTAARGEGALAPAGVGRETDDGADDPDDARDDQNPAA